MSAKVKERYSFGKVTASALIVFVIVVAALMFTAGSMTIGQTETIGLTTVTASTTITATLTSTWTSAQYITVTKNNFTTVNYVGPDTVQVSGSVSTSGIGTTPTYVVFQDEKNQTILATATNGAYSIALNNHHLYTVFIKFTTATAGVGAGQCSAGGFALYFTGTALMASWRC